MAPSIAFSLPVELERRARIGVGATGSCYHAETRMVRRAGIVSPVPAVTSCCRGPYHAHRVAFRLFYDRFVTGDDAGNGRRAARAVAIAGRAVGISYAGQSAVLALPR